ncbi:MAG: hypothetical protein AB4426_01920 [Xenococcaceae cyanobacterium]
MPLLVIDGLGERVPAAAPLAALKGTHAKDSGAIILFGDTSDTPGQFLDQLTAI